MLGKLNLGDYKYITFEELEKFPYRVYYAKEYNIKWIYKIELFEYYYFNKCYKFEEGDYVVLEKQDPSEVLK